MLLGIDAAKELNENGQPPGWVGCRCGKFVHTLAAHTGRRAWDGRLANFFFTAAFFQRRGAKKVEFCCAVWGFLQSREWSLWWGSNGPMHRGTSVPCSNGPPAQSSRDQPRVCLIICLIHANFRGRPLGSYFLALPKCQSKSMAIVDREGVEVGGLVSTRSRPDPTTDIQIQVHH